MRSIVTFLTMQCFVCLSISAQNVFTIRANKTYLNNKEFQVIGLRCSNALYSDESVNALIENLGTYKDYGINTISVYFMGSRYSDIRPYHMDGTIKEIHKKRMSKIIDACDEHDMVVLVGALYWGGTGTSRWNEHYDGWAQRDANEAVRNSIQFLTDNNYRNVFFDPDNEAMAHRSKKFDLAEMICEAKEVAPEIPVGFNMHGPPSSCADLSIHFGDETVNMPYIETEGTPPQYWGDYSKEEGLANYINIGIYTKGKKAAQIKRTKELLDEGKGYIFASTWLQAVPPNFHPGGDGSPCNPGIRWWLEFIRDNYK